VFKHPPRPDQDLSRELAEIGHHEFFLPDPKPWREIDPQRDHDDYHERLARVVFDLMQALEAMAGAQKQQARGKVFVATVAPELGQDRERLRADLRQRGWRVVPEHEYLWNADDHRDRIATDLDGAQLAVHLVARSASVDPLATPHARLQLELAHAAMKAQGRPPPLVWIRAGERTDAAQQPLVDFIEQDLANDGVDYLQGALEDLKTLMLDKLPAPQPAPAAAPRGIALLVDEAELADLGPLKALLADGLGLEPRPVKFDGSRPRDAERMARTLAACPQALIFWHRAPEEWVSDLLDLPALAPLRGPERLAIYATGTPSAEKTGFVTRQARRILALDGPAEAELRAFAAALPAGTR
jgi:hypothetical protein